MQVVEVQAPPSAATAESPLMFCTSVAVSSVPAAATVPPDPFDPLPPTLPMPGMLMPPVDGVGVVLVDDPPQPAIPIMAPTVTAPARSDVVFIRFLAVVRQRSLRAESPQMIAGQMAFPGASPNRRKPLPLVQSKQ